MAAKLYARPGLRDTARYFRRQPAPRNYSLIGQMISLLYAEFSLFRCAGNSIQETSKTRGLLGGKIIGLGRYRRKVPVDSLLIREFALEQSSIQTAHTASQSIPPETIALMLEFSRGNGRFSCR